MLETCIQVCFLFKAHNLLKMGMIDVGINTEKPLEYCLNNILKVRREWRPCKFSKGELISTQKR